MSLVDSGVDDTDFDSGPGVLGSVDRRPGSGYVHELDGAREVQAELAKALDTCDTGEPGEVAGGLFRAGDKHGVQEELVRAGNTKTALLSGCSDVSLDARQALCGIEGGGVSEIFRRLELRADSFIFEDKGEPPGPFCRKSNAGNEKQQTSNFRHAHPDVRRAAGVSMLKHYDK
jgi:hypothetical protein